MDEDSLLAGGGAPVLRNIDGKLIDAEGNLIDEDELMKEDGVQPLAPVDVSGVKEILTGAETRNQNKMLDRGQLQSKCDDLEMQVARLQDEVQLRTQLCDKANREIEQRNRRDLERKKKVDEAEARARLADASIISGIRGDDLQHARDDRKQAESDDKRVVVDKDHLLHPDTSCVLCGHRKLAEILPKEKTHQLEKVKVNTRRELAALLDMKDEWDSLGLQEGSDLMKERALKKEISSRCYTVAYKKCWCEHMLDAASEVEKVGVKIVGEDDAVSDAVTMALARAGGRASRKPLVVLMPRDSILLKATGEWKELEAALYDDVHELKRWMEDALKAGCAPRSLMIVLRATMSESKIEEIKEYCVEFGKKTEVTIYVTSDPLPAAYSYARSELAKAQQQILTKWRLRGSPVNLVILSAISGMLWQNHQFINIFTLAGRETKELFEKAVKFIVDGKPFPFDSIKERRAYVHVKRPTPWEGNKQIEGPSTPKRAPLFERRTSSKDKETDVMKNRKCYTCHGYGHMSRQCPTKDDNDE